jgi:hypothetical protein
MKGAQNLRLFFFFETKCAHQASDASRKLAARQNFQLYPSVASRFNRNVN